MKLKSAIIGPYKSIDSPQTLDFEKDVTVLVGQNEAGKSAVFEALFKTRPVGRNAGSGKFDAQFDYPRRTFNDYEKEHPQYDTTVVALRYELEDSDVQVIEAAVGYSPPSPFEFTVEHKYNNTNDIHFDVDESAALTAHLERSGVATEERVLLRDAKTYGEAIAILSETGEHDALVEQLRPRENATPRSLGLEAFNAIADRVPSFLYFSDYYSLSGLINLTNLASGPKSTDDEVAQAMLNVANVNINNLLGAGNHEAEISRLEAFSNKVTDSVFKYWTQIDTLDFSFNIHFQHEPRQNEPPPSKMLEIRVRDARHRVSLRFDQRSHGFKWFFSFFVWFGDAQTQSKAATPIVLLLDEPALSLHALAQADFLRFINDLGTENQVVYTTHSPFMVESDKLNRVRVIEDRAKVGTIISTDLGNEDPRSLFPLQAALGYTIAQNLFIAERNLLVEGPADLLFIQAASALLEAEGRTPLVPELVIVPAGGLDKVATFIALLAGNKLRFVVCTDRPSAPDQRLRDMVVSRIISEKNLLDYSMFRNAGNPAEEATDVEDIFDVAHYLQMFKAAYATELSGRSIVEGDLPPGSRIVDRIERALTALGFAVRPSGGFNHFRVASHAVSSGSFTLTAAEGSAFEALFQRVNALLP